MDDTKVDVIDVEGVEAPEDAPVEAADAPPDRLDDLVSRLDQLLVVADQVIESLQRLVENTTKPERQPLPPMASGGDAKKRSIYDM